MNRLSGKFGVALAAAVIGAWLPVSRAHHSAAMFDHDRTVVIKGVVKSVQYINPHVWISVVGSPDGAGAPEQWDIEATSPATLVMVGIQKDTLKPADKVAIAMHPLRDGRRGGSFVLVATADGKTYGAKVSEVDVKPEQLKP